MYTDTQYLFDCLDEYSIHIFKWMKFKETLEIKEIGQSVLYVRLGGKYDLFYLNIPNRQKQCI